MIGSFRRGCWAAAVVAGLASLPSLGCSGSPLDIDGEIGNNQSSYEDFKASVYREPKSGVFIVNGDTPLRDEAELRAFYEKHVQGGALIVHQADGVDAKWSDTQKLELTYCVSPAFGQHYGTVVTAMAEAAGAWEAAADVKFVYLSAEDGACDDTNPNVVFDVSPAPPGAPYLARAFFPNFDRSQRNILIVDEALPGYPPWSLAGILKHEVGHALGFRHEHTRPEAGWCIEDQEWRPLTGYDSASVMHYPQCNGTNPGDLELTQLDKDGAAVLYGRRPICVTIQRGAGGSVADATIASSAAGTKSGALPSIQAGESGGGARQALLRFDLSALPQGIRVQSATVTLRPFGSGTATVNVHRVTAPWDEGSVTHDGFGGAYDPAVAASFAVNSGAPAVVTFDARSLAAAWVKGNNNGLLLAQSDASMTQYRSSEHPAAIDRPKLDLCYIPAPVPPPSWTCDEAVYGADDGCHCGCGAPDLDCFKAGQQVTGCAAGETCTVSGTCKGPPPSSWTCDASHYDANDGCHCNCGAPDPDCSRPYQPVYGCEWFETCDAGGVCQPPICGDGVISGDEQCDPPDGVTCDENCRIIWPPESECTNFGDDDYDGLTDCQDPDCQALPICTPGNTPMGGACSAPSDCQATGNDPFCIDEPQFGWSGGYCTEFCDPALNDCPGDGVCLPVTWNAGFCFDGCQSNSDCRAGYTCQDFFAGAMVCAPAVEACSGGVDEDNDGLVDCQDPDCAWSYECAVCGDGVISGGEQCDPPDGATCDENCHIIYPPESECTNFSDDDWDGLTDCQDPDCQALPICTPGSTPVGGACSAPSDCQATGNDPFCIDEPQFGWPGGYCSEFCDLALNDCPGNGMCVQVTATSGICFAGCQSDADCRAGYACHDLGGPSPVCVP